MIDNVLLIDPNQETISLEYWHQGVNTKLDLEFQEREQFDTITVTRMVSKVKHPNVDTVSSIVDTSCFNSFNESESFRK